MSFAYAATRAKAMSARLFLAADFDRFLKMDANEIVRVLDDGDYGQEVEKSGVERALELNLARTKDKIASLQKTAGFWPVRKYLEKRELWNAKAKERGKNQLAEEMEKTLIAMQHAGDSETFVRKLGVSGIAGQKQEDAADLRFYKRLLRTAEEQAWERPIVDFIRTEIDAKNVLLALKAARLKIPKQELHETLIPGGKIRPDSILEAAGDKNAEEAFEALKKLRVMSFVSRLEDADIGLKKYLLASAKKFLASGNTSIAVVLGYLAAKEIEVENLRTLLQAKNAGLGEEETRRLLVV